MKVLKMNLNKNKRIKSLIVRRIKTKDLIWSKTLRGPFNLKSKVNSQSQGTMRWMM